MGQYATTTKPEGQTPHANVRDLFSKQSKASSSSEQQQLDAPSDPNISRL